ADLERWLADEPVSAYAEPRFVRAARWVRKHQPLVAGTLAAACVALCSLAVGLLVVASKAAAERRANEEAQKRLGQMEKGNEILTSIFAELDIRKVKEGTEPLEAVLSKGLVKAAEHLEGEAVGDSVIVAGLQVRLGVSLMNLGNPQEAVAILSKARETHTGLLGSDHPDTLTTMNHLAQAYEVTG